MKLPLRFKKIFLLSLYQELFLIAILLTFTFIIGTIGNLSVSLLSFLFIYVAINIYQIYRLFKAILYKEEHSVYGIWDALFYLIRKENKGNKNIIAKTKSELLLLENSLNSLKQGVVILNNNQRIIFFNKAAKKILNINIKNIGIKISYLIRDVEFGKFLENHNQIPYYIARLNLMHPDIKYIIETSKFKNKGNRKFFVISFAKLQDLEKVSDTHKVFISNASHELKTPLTAIRGFADALAMTANNKESQEFNKKLIKQIDRMQNLVDDMIELSSFEDERQNKYIYTEIDLFKLTQNVISDLSCIKDYQDRDIEVFKTGEIKYLCNENIMYSIFYNLIHNAMKYTLSKGEIRVRIIKDTAMIRIEIIDNGIGISVEHISSLTNRFYRVPNQIIENNQGSGLGLSIVKKGLELHKGELLIKSSPGLGSTFICQLPV